jgi:hypothetical protein
MLTAAHALSPPGTNRGACVRTPELPGWNDPELRYLPGDSLLFHTLIPTPPMLPGSCNSTFRALTRWLYPCRTESDIMPNAWAQYELEKTWPADQGDCSPARLQMLGRDSENVAHHSSLRARTWYASAICVLPKWFVSHRFYRDRKLGNRPAEDRGGLFGPYSYPIEGFANVLPAQHLSSLPPSSTRTLSARNRSKPMPCSGSHPRRTTDAPVHSGPD